MSPGNEVTIIDRQKKYEMDHGVLAEAVDGVLHLFGAGGQEVGIVLVSDRTMRGFNRQYRGVLGTTDVLSFAMQEAPHGKVGSGVLGDLVVSLEQIERQACVEWPGPRPPTGTLQRELALMVIHGLLHLLGFDHDTPGNEERMIRKESELFNETWTTFPTYSAKGVSSSSPKSSR